MFQLLLAPVHKVRYLLLGASQHLCGLPVAQFFKIDQKKCLPVFLFELAQFGVQLLVLFVLPQMLVWGDRLISRTTVKGRRLRLHPLFDEDFEQIALRDRARKGK